MSLRDAFTARRRALLERASLEQTIARLVDDGLLSGDEGLTLSEELPRLLADSAYVLGHLGAHAAIAGVFLLDVIPLPLGTACRVLWVAGSRGVETWRGAPERARVHSLSVLLVAAIPVVGYAAYLLPLRRESERAAFLLANHVSYALFDAPAETLIARSPRAFRGITRRVLGARTSGEVE